MRRLAILVSALALAAVAARASVCPAPAKTAPPRWTFDHYVYDASLRKEWAVYVDCNHPSAPARMELAPDIAGRLQPAKSAAGKPNASSASGAVKAGSAVEVSNSAAAPAGIRLSGTAMETAFPGQPIRVRLSVGGRFVTGLVRGPHSVELIAAAKPLWGAP
jgi:hypothetical protein